MDDMQARIGVLRPCAGDTILLSVPGRLTVQQREDIRRAAAEWMPADVKVLVLDSDITIAHVGAPTPVPAPDVAASHPHFDIWYRHRVNVAHAKYMERTSYSLSCDWLTFPPDAIERYVNGAGV